MKGSTPKFLAASLTAAEGLQQFIADVHPGYQPPLHLAPFTSLLEAIARGEVLLATISCPPRHGKSETAKAAVVWLLLRNPRLRILYVCYGDSLATDASRDIRGLGAVVGLRLSEDNRSVHRRATPEGGGVVA